MSNFRKLGLTVVAVGLTVAAAIMPEYAEAANGLRRSFANGL